MGDAVGVRDIDMDVHLFCKNDMLDNEGVLYIRTLREDDVNLDIYHEMAGNIGDLIGAFMSVGDLSEVVITAVALMIKEQGLDINKYIEQLDENTDH